MARVSAPTMIGKKKAAADTAPASTESTTPEPAPAPATRRRRTPRKPATKASAGAAGAAPEEETSQAGATPQSEAQPAGKGTATRPAMPPLPDGIPGEKRITLPLWHSMWRTLRLANVDDGIDTTVRIRSMIELWEHDPRLRARVDKLARERAAVLSRGRPRTRN